MRYATAENWAKYFKEAEGVKIAGRTIRYRLELAGIIGITGRNKIGRALKNAFYSEIDVRETCADLLMTVERIREQAKTALAQHDIHDRNSLIQIGTKGFTKLEFPPFGKGSAFASSVLGVTIKNISITHLNHIADILDLPQLSVKTKQQYIQALADNNIQDRQSLIQFGAKRFLKTDFPSFGKGRAFTSIVLGESSEHLSVAHLHQIADILGFPKFFEQYIQAFEVLGIHDRQTLIKFGPTKFSMTEFPPFGKGKAFAKIILGESFQTYMTIDYLHRIADALGFPNNSEESVKQQYAKLLVQNGIKDRQELIKLGPKKFEKTDFHPFGKGCAFVGAILGETIHNIRINHLNRIADILFESEEK